MQRNAERLTKESFDVAVIGGGIHGVWIAARAALAGYKVALIERDDFGAATSANSLKILHGGLRYLQHLDFRRMRSSIRARREYLRLHPHLAQPLQSVIPLNATSIRSPWIMGPALVANDVLSYDRNIGVESAARLPGGGLLSRQRAAMTLSPLAEQPLIAGALWWDGLANDTSRIVLETVQRAAAAGAVVANGVTATNYVLDGDRVVGIGATDNFAGGRYLEIKAAVTINATGPWSTLLSRASRLPHEFLPRLWVGSLNVVLKRSLGNEVAVALSALSKAAAPSVLGKTRRELFFVPWRGVTMVGTDYHPVPAPVDGVLPPPPAGAVEAFVAEIASVAPKARLSIDDVARVHWGLLPGQDDSGTVPRKSPIILHGLPALGAAGLVVVVPEKFTSAPTVSQTVLGVIKHAVARKGVPPAREAVKLPPRGVADFVRLRLLARYGGENWASVLETADGRPEWLTPVFSGVSPMLVVEVIHAIRHEMALELSHVLRRVGLDDAGPPPAELVRKIDQLARAEWASLAAQGSI